MSDATYTKDYGAVQFYDTSGTLLFDSVETYDLWTSADNEPSPEVKWTRVSVPGADGAVDLSRALAGQVTYEQREIDLQFSGKQADHEAGVAFLRVMRAMLHGARVRIATVLTNLAGGYYVADCECDGTVYPDGAVQIDVHAVADPFIHVGTQTLALPASTATTSAAAMTQATNSDLLAGAARLTVAMNSTNATIGAPKKATSGKLWYACGDSADTTNVFDLTQGYTVAGYDSDGSSTYVYDSDVVASGHDIVCGTLDGSYTFKFIYISALNRTGSISESYFKGSVPFLSGDMSLSPSHLVGIYLTGTISSVGDPSKISIRYRLRTADTDDYGRPTTGGESGPVGTTVVAPAARTYDDTLIWYGTIDDTDCIDALVVRFYNIVGTNLSVRIAAIPSTGTMPDHWPAPSVGYVGFDFGGTFARTYGATDTAEITALGVTTTHNCAITSSGYRGYAIDTPYTTTGSIDGWFPSDAQLICATVTNSYGEDCPANLAMDTYGITTVSGTNGTMRSTPSIVSDSGAYIAIGDQSAVVAGGTVELGEFTLGAGSFAVTYATLGETDATLTWEGGVL